MKRRSSHITGNRETGNWFERTAARTMLRAVRFTEEDFDQPLIALAVPYTNGTPCNDHIRVLGDLLQAEIEAAGCKVIIFGTPVVSDGIPMGTEAMKYSLVSREVIADSIELMTEGYQVDGVITLCGCDKTIPAALMPIARNNLVGGVIALVLEGDQIIMDLDNDILQLSVTDEEIESRRKNWQAPSSTYQSGVLAKYARLVSSAAEGVVTS